LNYGLIRNPSKIIYSDSGRGLAPKAPAGALRQGQMDK